MRKQATPLKIYVYIYSLETGETSTPLRRMSAISSRISFNAWLTSRSVITSGGHTLTVDAEISVPATKTRRRSKPRAHPMPLSLLVNSTASMSPRPRTSFTISGYAAARASSPACNWAPRDAAAASKSLSIITLTVAMRAAMAKGLPPKVDVNRKGSSTYFSHIAAVPQHADSGITPPPALFPTHSKSGTTPLCSQANQLPGGA